MKLLELYTALNNREITLEQAAAALGVTEKGLKIRMSKHGLRLPSILDQVQDNTITRDQAAEALQVGVRTVNALMVSWSVMRPVAPRTLQKATSAVKWEVRKRFACDFIAGRLNLAKASEAAGIDERQMRRWVSQLLGKHFGMVYKDLAHTTPQRLREISQEILDKERIEEEALRASERVSEGDMTEKEVGARRVVSRRIERRKGMKRSVHR